MHFTEAAPYTPQSTFGYKGKGSIQVEIIKFSIITVELEATQFSNQKLRVLTVLSFFQRNLYI